MTTTVIPTEHDIESLRNQLAAVKRKSKYEDLKTELCTAVHQATTSNNEINGVIQVADNYKVLKSKRTKRHFVEIVLSRILGMFSMRPIIGSIIALTLAGVALFYIFNETSNPFLMRYQTYFAIGIQLFAAVQIIKSSTRSLLLPVLALVAGSIIAHNLAGTHALFHLGRAFYQHLMVVGIIGTGFAILAID